MFIFHSKFDNLGLPKKIQWDFQISKVRSLDSRLKKLILNYPSRFEMRIANNNTHGGRDFFVRAIYRFTHPSDQADRFPKGN